MTRTLASLDEAIEWAQSRWANQRTVPSVLHESHTTEGALGAPRFTGAFAAALDGRPDTVIASNRTETCYHPLLPLRRPERDCPECIGTKVKEVRSDLYAFPMTLALHRLRNGLASRRHPHPYGLVVVLAAHGWMPRQAARALDLPWDRAEALFLMALRKLHSHYAEGPVKTSRSTVGEVRYEGPNVTQYTSNSRTVFLGKWTDLSDSQRAAIEAGEGAA